MLLIDRKTGVPIDEHPFGKKPDAEEFALHSLATPGQPSGRLRSRGSLKAELATSIQIRGNGLEVLEKATGM
jgi:hypothetical protein